MNQWSWKKYSKQWQTKNLETRIPISKDKVENLKIIDEKLKQFQ